MTNVVATQKRTVVTTQEKKGLGVQSLILIAVLLAAGAVLKLTVSSFLTFAGMKPNFMIAMYCLAIILTRPKIYQAAIIGILTGLISQIPMLNATPLANIPSEFVGALVCGVLLAAFIRIAPKNFSLQNVVFPLIITFIHGIFWLYLCSYCWQCYERSTRGCGVRYICRNGCWNSFYELRFGCYPHASFEEGFEACLKSVSRKTNQ